MVAHTCCPSTQEAHRLDDCEFEANLDCTVRPDLKRARSLDGDPCALALLCKTLVASLGQHITELFKRPHRTCDIELCVYSLFYWGAKVERYLLQKI